MEYLHVLAPLRRPACWQDVRNTASREILTRIIRLAQQVHFGIFANMYPAKFCYLFRWHACVVEEDADAVFLMTLGAEPTFTVMGWT